MTTVLPLRTSSGISIYVEVIDGADFSPPSPPPEKRLRDLPPGAEPTSAVDSVVEGMTAFQAGLRDVIESIGKTIRESDPSAWKLELSIGFKGKTSPIPVILSGEANAALKLQVEWKK